MPISLQIRHFWHRPFLEYTPVNISPSSQATCTYDGGDSLDLEHIRQLSSFNQMRSLLLRNQRQSTCREWSFTFESWNLQFIEGSLKMIQHDDRNILNRRTVSRSRTDGDGQTQDTI